MKEKILSNALEQGVKYIRLQFTDLLGMIKNVEIPVSELENALDGKTMFDGSSIEGFVRTTETDMYLIPDLSTWLILEFEESKYGKVARLICDVNKMDNTPFEGDPRQNLKRILKKMNDLGFTSFNIGFEPEFYLFKLENNKRTLEFTDVGGYFDQSPIDGSEDVRRDIVLELERLGFQMEASHHEVGPGQHEINFRFADALKACDNLQTFKLVVKNNARKHGMHATFMAKPISSVAGSGMHANCSLFANDVNSFVCEDDSLGLSETCYQFIAGVMHHARAITAVANPTVNSYKRLTPGYEAPVYIGWSPANRSSFIRIPASRGLGTRVEVRSVDAMSNPYLALAVILEAGLDGITKQMKCVEPIYKNLFKLTRSEREQLGILNLPNNLYDALKDLKQNKVICEALGKHILEKFLCAKSKEWDNYRVSISKWEIDEYIDRY